MKRVKTLLIETFKPYSSILFLNNKIAGGLVLLTTFINPSVAISGLIAIFFTILFAKLIEIKDEVLIQGFYVYNSLLVGMGVGYIFSPSLISIVLIAGASIFTLLLSFMLNKLFIYYKIPILSLPFSIVTMFVYLASLKYSALYSTLVNNATIYDIQLPQFISAFLKAFGTIFFLPNNIVGIILLLIVGYFSRIILIMAIVGFYFGVLTHSFLVGSYTQSLSNPYSFNYILVAIALCGIFLLPTLKNFILSLIGVFISVVLTDAIETLFNYYAIPVFTLPFNLTVISFIFILSLTYYKEFNYNIKSTPEESLSNYLDTIFRFGEYKPKIALPFSGEWSVYQAFDDVWTHKGNYKYAYDFVKEKDNKTYASDGNNLNDYYAFGESILAPVSGYIVDCRDDLIDNYIGSTDRINNWGNYIIIKSDAGYFVKICHLMQYSLLFKVGDYVKVNDIIAKCGNSGYSPQPHIHLQVQNIGVLGGFTKEFYFKEYYKNNKLIFNSLPKKGEIIGAPITNQYIISKLLFILDEEFEYEVFKDNQKIETIKFIVKMNELGEFYLSDKDDNKLYFANDSMQFYFYNYEGKYDSYLKWFFILLPRFPFVNRDNITYDDYLPIKLLKNKLQTIAIELLSTINRDFAKIKQEYKYLNNSITSNYGKITLENLNKGFSQIEYKNITLKRIHNEKTN